MLLLNTTVVTSFSLGWVATGVVTTSSAVSPLVAFAFRGLLPFKLAALNDDCEHLEDMDDKDELDLSLAFDLHDEELAIESNEDESDDIDEDGDEGADEFGDE